MSISKEDQRDSRREAVFSPVRFQYPNMSEPEEGIIANISSSGIMLWTSRDYCPAGNLTIWLLSGGDEAPTVAVAARVVRTEPTYDKRFAFGFGCTIVDESVDPVTGV